MEDPGVQLLTIQMPPSLSTAKIIIKLQIPPQDDVASDLSDEYEKDHL